MPLAIFPAESDVVETLMRLAFQLAAILLAAKVFGEICDRYLRIPSVIGELLAGVAIGPFALGQFALPADFGPLFPVPLGYGMEGGPTLPLSIELWSIGQVAAIVLLFLAGLETNSKLFFRYAGPSIPVAAGGVILPFVFGAGAIAFFKDDIGFSDTEALFMGAVMVATSVGITARVLEEQRKLDSPEGVTVLAAAVLDDILGILVLTVVIGIHASGSVSVGEIVWIGAKAVIFLAALLAVGFLGQRLISKTILSFRTNGAAIGLALFLALLASGLAETFGLAMIIGAYAIGLALSESRLRHAVEEKMGTLANAIVPIFFCTMGMLVDVTSLVNAIGVGAVITVLAIIGKVFGSGVPALGVGFNMRGASRIGFGMLPRGEVALIVAGIGLSNGIIQQELFDIAIMMTIVTTIIAPIALKPLFTSGGSGLRKPGPEDGGEAPPDGEETPSPAPHEAEH